MKTLLITDVNLGQVCVYMTETLLGAATRKAKLEIIDNPNSAGMTTVLGDSIPNDSALNGENVRPGDTSQAVVHPELFLSKAKGYAKPYAASVAATAPVTANDLKCVVAVTVRPTGVAHAFIAARAVEIGAKKRGWWVRIRTHGSVGASNTITPEEVAVADLVIVAADIGVDLTKFAGEPMYRTSTGLALKKAAQELDKAATEAAPYEPVGKTQAATAEGKRESAGVYRHLLTGVSYMLLMVVAGSLCIAPPFAFGIEAFEEPGTLAAALIQIGGGSVFALMVPVLADYIVFSIADHPGLAPGLIGGMLAVNTGPDFIGGVIAGFLADYVAKSISTQLKLSQSIETLRPILVISLTLSLVADLAMIYLVGKPVAGILGGLTHWLQIVGTTNMVLLGTVLGGMMCTDMGGPVNKAAYAFGVGLPSTQTYGPMVAVMVTGMVPPLAVDLATMVTRCKFDKAQQEGGKATLVLGLCSISEDAIPFATRDPIYVLPCCIIGGAPTGAILVVIGAKLMVPHGSLFALLILGATIPVLGYLVVITAGTLVAGLAYVFLKRSGIQIVEKNI